MTMNKKFKRKKLFIDRKVQGALAIRVAFYWLCCVLTIGMLLLAWRALTNTDRLWYYDLDQIWYLYGPALVASLAMLPLIIYDMIELSNRFAGPMLRLRRAMRALARGEHVDPVRFRTGDFWHDFAEDFNTMVARVQDGVNQERPTKTVAKPPQKPVEATTEESQPAKDATRHETAAPSEVKAKYKDY